MSLDNQIVFTFNIKNVKKSLDDFSLKQNVYVLRSNAKWDNGWKVKSKTNNTITLSKNHFTKRFNRTQASLFIKQQTDEESPPKNPSLCDAILLGDLRLVDAIIPQCPNCNEAEELDGYG